MTSSSLMTVMYCALQRPALLWALLAWCIAIPASVHLFHDLPKLAYSAWLGAVWDIIHVLYLTAPSLLWALWTWCTVPVPASVHLFHDLPKLANSAWFGAHSGPSGSGVAVIEAQCPASSKIKAAITLDKKIEFNTKTTNKTSNYSTYLTR